MTKEKIKTKSRIVMMGLSNIILDFAEKEQDLELQNRVVDVLNHLIKMKDRD